MFDFIITGYRWIFLQMASVLGPGWAIVALSFICSALMAPLMKAVGGIVRRETEYQSVINPQLDAIKTHYPSDMERHLHIQRLYSRYSYSPLSAIKKVMPLFVQIPFLLLTYYMLKGTEELAGVSFLFLPDLGQQDSLIAGVNLLPLIMTAVNILTVFATPNFSHRDWVQAIGIALLFLVLLYSAPSALLLYWTLNNVITFARTLSEQRGAGGLLLRKRAYALPTAIIRQMFVFWSQENVAWGVFATFMASCFMTLTWNGILSLTDTNGGLTQFVSIRGTLPLIACSAILSTCLAVMSKSRKRKYALFLRIFVVVFIVGLHILIVFNNNLFKLFFAQINIFVLVLILLGTIVFANILVSKREKDSAIREFFMGHLREWAGGCVIIALGGALCLFE